MNEDCARQEEGENKLAEKLESGFGNDLGFRVGQHQAYDSEGEEFQQWENRA